MNVNSREKTVVLLVICSHLLRFDDVLTFSSVRLVVFCYGIQTGIDNVAVVTSL